MSETTDLFGDEEITEPSFQRTNESTRETQPEKAVESTNLFESKAFLEGQIDKLVQIKKHMNDLYDELGDGKINNQLTSTKRNDIIESLINEKNKLGDVLDETYAPIDKNIKKTSSLQLIITTTTDGFDRLLNPNMDNGQLSADEIQFQRRD